MSCGGAAPTWSGENGRGGAPCSCTDGSPPRTVSLRSTRCPGSDRAAARSWSRGVGCGAPDAARTVSGVRPGRLNGVSEHADFDPRAHPPRVLWARRISRSNLTDPGSFDAYKAAHFTLVGDAHGGMTTARFGRPIDTCTGPCQLPRASPDHPYLRGLGADATAHDRDAEGAFSRCPGRRVRPHQAAREVRSGDCTEALSPPNAGRRHALRRVFGAANQPLGHGPPGPSGAIHPVHFAWFGDASALMTTGLVRRTVCPVFREGSGVGSHLKSTLV